ncbi:hypothetical protein PJ912_27405 [Pectobacterium colocasium]|uniref:hypothetical protein n=1 Tax=Pectobacterium colocasium TaxID=2878098 RepID=UPI003D714298
MSYSRYSPQISSKIIQHDFPRHINKESLTFGIRYGNTAQKHEHRATMESHWPFSRGLIIDRLWKNRRGVDHRQND